MRTGASVHRGKLRGLAFMSALVAIAMGLSACGSSSASSGDDRPTAGSAASPARVLSTPATTPSVATSSNAGVTQDCATLGGLVGAVDDKGTVVLTGSKVTIEPGSDNKGKGGFFFTPTCIVAKPGTLITLTVKNTDFEGHNFSITELGIDEFIQNGKSMTFKVKVPVKNPLVFFCNLAFHLGAGMQGAIVPSP
jgi:plastocyanin